MKSNFGPYYSEAHRGTEYLAEYWSVKKYGRYGRYAVHEIRSGKVYDLFPNKLRAYYVANLLNGVDMATQFEFGSGMFGG